MENNRPSLSKYKSFCTFGLRCFAFCIISLHLNNTVAQESLSGAVKVITRPMPDSILLRWAPSSIELWRIANKTGYVIERFTLMRNGELLRQPKGSIITPNPLKPLPLNKWETLSKNDEYIGVAAQAIYGESFEVSAQKGTGIMDIVNKAIEQENRFSFALFAADQSPLTAKASGLWFTDRNVKKGEAYLYKVYLANPAPFKVDTGYVFISVDEYKPLPKPLNLNAAFSDKSVFLTWNKQGAERYYNGFYIEKSIDNGKTFRQINTKPFINPENEGTDRYPFYFYIDSLHGNDQKYCYRVYGISPFGEKGPVSDTVLGKGLDQVKDNPHIINKEIIKDKIVRITWEFPSNKNTAISGFKILRSNNDKSGYKTISGIITADERMFTDTFPMPVNYYKVLAYKEGGLASISLSVLVQMPDSIPPAPPVGLDAKADTTGKIIITWSKNTEPDIYGYRVYRANSAKEEFSQLTVAPISDTFFVDRINLKTLTKRVYYQLLAIDKRQNFSGFSEVLEVNRPDIIPPVAPVFENAEVVANGIRLQWVNSTSSDVVKHTLYRQAENAKNKEKVIDFTDTTSSYVDSTAQNSVIYRYTITATDNSGLESRSPKPVAIKCLNRSRNEIFNLKYKVDRENNTILLSWDISSAKVKRYLVYRSVDENPLSLYISVEGSALNFTDTKLRPGTKYSYAIKAIWETDSQSRISKVIVINF